MEGIDEYELDESQTNANTRLTSRLYLLIVIGVLGLANWLANRHNKSVDTTSNKRFSLSDQTEEDRQRPEAGRRDHLLRQDRELSSAPRICSTVMKRSRRSCTSTTSIRTRSRSSPRRPAFATTARIVIDAGPRREEAKSLTEEEVTGAMIRTLKGGERTVCFVPAAASMPRRHRPQRLLAT